MMRPALVWTDTALRFGVDRQQVLALVRAPELSPVPLAPGWLAGVINRFGRAVAVVDVGLLCGLKAGHRPPQQVIIVEGTWGELGIALAEPPRDELYGPVVAGEGLFDAVSVPVGLRLISPEGLARSLSTKLGAPHA